MDLVNIKNKLDNIYNNLNAEEFISFDPISIPHKFSNKKDIEISGFLTALLSWGRRDMILKSANTLLQFLNNNPYEFILNANNKDLNQLDNFVYRTINNYDIKFILKSLQTYYRNHDDMEYIFTNSKDIISGIISLRNKLLSAPHQKRVERHISNPLKQSACKRIFMFLRWMIRKDFHNIDFGIWETLSPKNLIIPLDVHTGNSARQLGFTTRKANDLKTAIEITEQLKKLDNEDPIKYDYSLFCLDL